MFLTHIASLLCFLLYLSTTRSLAPRQSQREEELQIVLKSAAGVYKDASKNPSLSKTVIVTGGNYGYLNHVHNLKCWLDRIGMKFLVFALDPKAHKILSLDKEMNVFYWTGEEGVDEAPTEWQSSQFHVITNRKKEAALGLLERNYDVIFIDTDVAVFRDFMPYLLWNNVNYVHSVNSKCPQSDAWDFRRSDDEGNTGFYYVRSTPQTIKVFSDSYMATNDPRLNKLDDQTIFWEVIRKSSDPEIIPLPKCKHFDEETRKEIEAANPAKKQATTGNYSAMVTCHLDGCVFSSGAPRGLGPSGSLKANEKEGEAYGRLRVALANKKETLVSVHANYIVGNHAKQKGLDDHGYWLATKNPDGTWGGKCKEFVPRPQDVSMHQIVAP